jgi:hypothetical protein
MSCEQRLLLLAKAAAVVVAHFLVFWLIMSSSGLVFKKNIILVRDPYLKNGHDILRESFAVNTTVP